MVNRIYAIYILLFSLSFGSCLVLKDDTLTLNKSNVNTTSLELNGYYYHDYGSIEEFVSIYFFYKNGVLINTIVPKSELEESETEFKNGKFYSKIKDVKLAWGVFNINTNEIIIEKWSAGDKPYKIHQKIGVLNSNNNFQLNKILGSNNITRIKMEYNFKPFSPKPDSTNTFIK